MRTGVKALVVVVGAGLLATAARAAEPMVQAPTICPIAELAPGVLTTNEKDVFVLRNGSMRPHGAGGVDLCPEVPLKYWTGAPTTACQCFAIGEEAGVIFQAPANHYPLDILRVNIAWGTAGPVCDPILPELHAAINLYLAGPPTFFSNPDKFLDSPGLVCGSINSFDLPLLGVIPWRVNSGKFTVSLEFDGATNIPPFPGTIVHDGNGCTSGKNLVKFQSGTWFDACQLGVSGDWAIEIVYRRVSCACLGDINGDNMVDFFDLNGVLSQYGQTAPGLAGDVNSDGRVDFADLNIVLGAFGIPC